MAVATTEFTAHKTEIPGLLIFDISAISDERGYFQEKYQKAKLVQAGMPASFNVVQNSLSYNKDRGVTRGFHAEPWDKYISVVLGKAFGAYVDLRKGLTFGKVVTVEISPNVAVYLPRGVANGFQTTEPATYYLYSVNAHWSPDNYEQYAAVNLVDPAITVPWPVGLDQAIISERDKSHPLLTEIVPMEVE